MKQSFGGEYPVDWPEIAYRTKQEAHWKCVRCGHDHEPEAGYTLTVHHLDGNRSNCHWWNTPALCQRCHLSIQGRVIMARPWIFEHSGWFQPYVAGFYAAVFLNENLSRGEVMSRLADLLALQPAVPL